MLAGQQKKVGVVAVRIFKPIPLFGDFCSIEIYRNLLLHYITTLEKNHFYSDRINYFLKVLKTIVRVRTINVVL